MIFADPVDTHVFAMSQSTLIPCLKSVATEMSSWVAFSRLPSVLG